MLAAKSISQLRKYILLSHYFSQYKRSWELQLTYSRRDCLENSPLFSPPQMPSRFAFARLAGDLAAHHRVSVLVDAIGEVLTGKGDPTSLPSLKLPLLDTEADAPLVSPRHSIQNFFRESSGSIAAIGISAPIASLKQFSFPHVPTRPVESQVGE